MKEFDYEKKKKDTSYYIKFSFFTLLACTIVALIWGLISYQHKTKILQYGEDTLGVVINKGYGKSSKKSPSPVYFIRFECIIDYKRYNMTENISKEGYDTIQIGQVYTVKYLPNRNPIYNSMILFNRPIKGNVTNRMP